MVNRYRTEIDTALVDILLETDTIRCNELYRALKEKVGSLSWETFMNRIKKMLEENFIQKEEIESNQKINPVFYSMTKQTRKKLPH